MSAVEFRFEASASYKLASVVVARREALRGVAGWLLGRPWLHSSLLPTRPRPAPGGAAVFSLFRAVLPASFVRAPSVHVHGLLCREHTNTGLFSWASTKVQKINNRSGA